MAAARTAKSRFGDGFEVASAEVDEYSQYEYVVVNDDIEAAVGRLQSIVGAERARVKRVREDAEAIIGTFHS